MKSYSLSATTDSSNWLDDPMAPPAANREHDSPPVPISDDRDYNVENIEAIRHDFLLKPTEILRRDVVWKNTPLPEYDGLYAVILDNALTAQECEILIKQAETTTNGVWEQATVNVGGGMQQLVPDSRDCGRIIWDNKDMVARIWDRVKGYVPEIQHLINEPRVTGKGPAKRKEIWTMSRCNERMRFLKYGEGQYFKRKSPQRPHVCSGFLTCTSTHGRLLFHSRQLRTLLLYATPLPKRGSNRRRNHFPFLGRGAPTRRRAKNWQSPHLPASRPTSFWSRCDRRIEVHATNGYDVQEARN